MQNNAKPTKQKNAKTMNVIKYFIKTLSTLLMTQGYK